MVYIEKYDAYVDSDGVVYRMGKHGWVKAA